MLFVRVRLACPCKLAMICVVYVAWLCLSLSWLCLVVSWLLRWCCIGVSFALLGMAWLFLGTSKGPHREAVSVGMQQARWAAMGVAIVSISISLLAIVLL